MTHRAGIRGYKEEKKTPCALAEVKLFRTRDSREQVCVGKGTRVIRISPKTLRTSEFTITLTVLVSL